MTLLREGALPSLLEMAQWKSYGPAGAPFHILGRDAGVPEAEIDKGWDRRDRSSVFAAADKSGSATNGNEAVELTPPQKNRGPRLGSGAHGRRVPLLASFSHQRVGSSILASLSEAGGNDR
jgi:hypothetical protein